MNKKDESSSSKVNVNTLALKEIYLTLAAICFLSVSKENAMSFTLHNSALLLLGTAALYSGLTVEKRK